MKQIIFLLLVASLFMACKKEGTEKNVFAGQAFFKNSFAADTSSAKPMNRANVYVRHTNDTRGTYFYSTVTDADGRFFLDIDDKPFVVYVEQAINLGGDTIVFYSEQQVGTDLSSIQLIATPDMMAQNLLHLVLRDDMGGILPNSTFRLYASAFLASFDNAALALATETSDANGRVIVKYPAVGIYYANATLTIDDTTVYSRIGKQLAIVSSGIHNDSLILHRKTPVYRNGFRLMFKDTVGGNLNNCQVNVYGSASLAAANDPSNALYHLSSTADGHASQYDIPSGYYYVNAILPLTNGTYRRSGKQINVPVDGVIIDSMVLYFYP